MSMKKKYILSAFLAVATMASIIFYTAIAIAFTQATSEPRGTSTESLTLQTVNLDKQKIYELVNSERAKEGLNPLTTNVLLEQSACLKAQDMLDKNYWSHDAPDGTQPWFFFENTGYVYDLAGENLAYGYRTDEALVDGWMKSELHRKNILANYEESGLCVLNNITYQGDVGTNLIVHHFGTLR